jgi:hypothetical protein
MVGLGTAWQGNDNVKNSKIAINWLIFTNLIGSIFMSLAIIRKWLLSKILKI